MAKKEQFNHREYSVIDESSPFDLKEAYNALRTNLLFVIGAKKTNIIVFTSGYANEGKTSTCANIALSFAMAGARSLIIDADMRKPKVHRIFDVNMSPGLSDVLCGNVTDDTIQKTKYNNLYAMSVGKIPPNPAELLVSTNMEKMLDAVSEGFDYVFIDTPPVGLVTDAAVIARRAGGAVLIVRKGRSRKEGIRAAKNALEQAGTGVIGYVFTDVDSDSGSYRGYYGGKYGYGYDYSGGYGHGYGTSGAVNPDGKPKGKKGSEK